MVFSLMYIMAIMLLHQHMGIRLGSIHSRQQRKSGSGSNNDKRSEPSGCNTHEPQSGSSFRNRMTDKEQEQYDAYNKYYGNRDYLFDLNSIPTGGAGFGYDIPAEALSDPQFAKMIREAEKYLGYPYVWGGASPSTSFDCSGFVCWVINNCGNGWNVGRTTADGLRSYCSYVSPSDAKPGDLIFFQGTYDTPGASHVGIYVGNNMMIHCGNPIQYTKHCKFLLAATFYGIWQTSLEGSK